MKKVVTLSPVKEENLPVFKQEIQAAFMKGLQESFPEQNNSTEMGPILINFPQKMLVLCLTFFWGQIKKELRLL